MTNTIIWSKDNCPYCDMAKNLLNTSGIAYEERKIQTGQWTKEELLEAVPNAKTVPQIFVHGEYVGGFNELEVYYENHNMYNGKESF
jgi:glutaredoxin 3